MLTAHLIENDTRGALTFIDKALGLRALRDILETERAEPLSQRQLVEALKERGYGLDQSTISRMDYAVDVLLSVIPEALRTGMGAPQIRRIRRLEAAARVAWSRQAEGSARFEALFQEVLAAHDGPHWELEPVQRQLETQLAEALGVSLKEVRLEMDARLARGTEEESTPNPAPEPDPQFTPAASPSDEKPSVEKITEATVPEATDPSPVPATDSTTTRGQERKPAHTAAQDTSSNEVPPGLASPHLATSAVASYAGPNDLKSLRSRAYVLALKIAQRHGLGDCVTPARRLGMGFLVDLPGESLLPVAGDEHALAQLYRQWVWWLLLSFSEEVVHPERMERVPEELLLRNLILERTDAQALALVGEPDWKALGYEFLNNPSIPEPTIEDLVTLAQTCRRIRKTMNDHGGLTLWQPDEVE